MDHRNTKAKASAFASAAATRQDPCGVATSRMVLTGPIRPRICSVSSRFRSAVVAGGWGMTRRSPGRSCSLAARMNSIICGKASAELGIRAGSRHQASSAATTISRIATRISSGKLTCAKRSSAGCLAGLPMDGDAVTALQ